MKCLRCGRETQQTFCEACIREMDKYPVKPGTIVLLPKERTPQKKPQTRRPAVPLEQIVTSQRRTIHRLSRGFAVLLVLLALTCILTVRLLRDADNPPLGQNYSTVTRPAETTEEAEPVTQNLDDVIAPAELEDSLLYQQEHTAIPAAEPNSEP